MGYKVNLWEWVITNTLIHLYLDANGITSIASMEGINFVRLCLLNLSKNRITHLRPEFLITPNLKILILGDNNLFLLADVTQYWWGSSLLKHEYMKIYLQMNPWHCNGSLIWMLSNLYKKGGQAIYAKPPFKPILPHVQRLVCMSPDGRRDTTVVPIKGYCWKYFYHYPFLARLSRKVISALCIKGEV